MGVKKEKIPAPPKEEMEELIKQHHGSINAMSLAKGVSWQVVKNWLRELGLEDFAKEESQRYKDTINKLNELKKLCNKKKTPSTATPAEELPEPQATAPGPDNPSPPAIIGVGPDTPEHINEAGGRESDIPYRCDLLGARAILEIARILYKGAKKYKENNWRLISCRSHINHALTHIFAYLAGDTQDEHLEHALCRMMMAVETKNQNI
ncbi:dATP/dGTP diphosphohydrolase domain-containing protein [Thermincola ferriacetica]